MPDFRPQEGAQSLFLSSPADIAIYGGGAGAGKTVALLLESSRHINVPGYNAVLFRREFKQVVSSGGIRDAALQIYPFIGGVYRSQPTPQFIFNPGAKISFAHLNTETETLAWQGAEICMIGFDELTHFCVDDQTEALTNNGWKSIKDIKTGELVASLSNNREIQYKPVTNVYESNYSGEMVVINQKSGLNIKVTPNHRMVVNVGDSGLKGKAAYGSWKFMEAKDLLTCSIPRTGDWIGKEVENIYFSPIIGRGYGKMNSNSDIEVVPMDDWLSFLGWYLSEGCCYRRNNKTKTCVVAIRQTKKQGQILLEQTLDRLPWRYCKTSDGQYLIFSRQLYEELVDFGNAYEKRVPRWIFSLSKRQISLFLDTFTHGDGHVTKLNGIQFAQANEGLVDDLQELYFLCGRVSTKGYGFLQNKYHSWRLSVSNPKRSHCFVHHRDIDSEFYDGRIYCLSVKDNENFLMRRNGRFCWTGNSQYQFEYLMSRNRSTCGVRPLIRATTNPDADSWVKDFISWWIDEETGYPIKERSGKLRYMVRIDGERKWGNSRKELSEQYGCDPLDAKSVTFVAARITDNPILLRKDPGYLANLKALSKVERARLLDGNWKIRAEAGMYFPRDDAVIIDWKPEDKQIVKWIRSWDLAASEESESRDPDWTVGILGGRKLDGKIVIADVIRLRRKADYIEQLIRNVAFQDGKDVWVCIPQDPGAAGKAIAESYNRLLSGFTILSRAITKNKVMMASSGADSPAALWQRQQIELVRANWNKDFIDELDAFPTRGVHDDQCFVAGTLIATEFGEIPIESIIPGMYVWTRKGWRKVLAAKLTNHLASVVSIRFSDGVELTGTANHPIICKDNSIVKLQDLSDCDNLVWLDFVRDRVLEGKTIQENLTRVYNLSVEGENEYFANGILVHNCDALSALVRNLPGHAKPDYSQSGLSGKFKPYRVVQRVKSV